MLELLRKHRIAVIGMAFTLLLVGVVAWNLVIPHRDPALDAIRSQGLPITLAGLNEWYSQVPPAENAALIYSEAFTMPLFNSASSGSGAPALDNATLPTRGNHFTPENMRDLMSLLEHNQDVLRLLYSVPARGRSRYPIDLNQGFNTPLPELPKLRTAVQLLTAEAMLHADNGEVELAVKALLAAGRAADSPKDEPLLISQLVRIACWSIVVARLERVLNLASPSEEQMASLQTAMKEAEQHPAMFRAMVGEQAIGVAFFTTPKGQAAFFASQLGAGGKGQADRIRAAASLSLLKLLGIFQKDKSVFMQVMATNVAAARLPFPERFQRGKEVDNLVSSLAGRLCIFSRIMLPALSRAMSRDAELAARLRVAQTGLALQRFRRSHNGAVPLGLGELVPSYLEAVPCDPFDGQPLRFKKLDQGYVVYSIGSDEKDNGGQERDPKKYGSPYDITFIVER